MSHGGLKRARSWKRRTQPKEAYSSPGLLYSEGSWHESLVHPALRLITAHTRLPLISPKDFER